MATWQEDNPNSEARRAANLDRVGALLDRLALIYLNLTPKPNEENFRTATVAAVKRDRNKNCEIVVVGYRNDPFHAFTANVSGSVETDLKNGELRGDFYVFVDKNTGKRETLTVIKRISVHDWIQKHVLAQHVKHKKLHP